MQQNVDRLAGIHGFGDEDHRFPGSRFGRLVLVLTIERFLIPELDPFDRNPVDLRPLDHPGVDVPSLPALVGIGPSADFALQPHDQAGYGLVARQALEAEHEPDIPLGFSLRVRSPAAPRRRSQGAPKLRERRLRNHRRLMSVAHPGSRRNCHRGRLGPCRCPFGHRLGAYPEGAPTPTRRSAVYLRAGLATETFCPPQDGQAWTVTSVEATRLTTCSVSGWTICWHPSQRTISLALFSSVTGESLK